MKNIFMQKNHNEFSWDKLGDIKAGRGELGEEMPVIVYRLMEYCLNDVLVKEGGIEFANTMFRRAGHLAGSEFAKNVLNLNQDIDGFIAELHQTLINLKIGILRIESHDAQSGEITLTVGEDLDCSGLPPTNELVCNYDEGFLAGILETYTGKPYEFRETDCWANGDRVCRFKGVIKD